MSSSPITGLVISMGAMQLARKVPFDNPDVLNYVRIAYVSVQVLALLAHLYTSAQIKKKNDLTVLKYVEPAKPLQQSDPKVVTTTVKDYDLEQASGALKGVYMGIAFMAFMHLYMKYTQPLFAQSITGLKAIYDAKEVKIHILGQKAEGDLARPFKAAPSMFGGPSPATDAATIKETEEKAKKMQ